MQVRLRFFEYEQVARANEVLQEQDERRKFGDHGGSVLQGELSLRRIYTDGFVHLDFRVGQSDRFV